MASLKSSLARTLRSRIPAQTPRLSSAVSRNLTVTTNNAIQTEVRQPSPVAPLFLPAIQQPQSQPSTTTQHDHPGTTPFNTLLNALTHSLSTTPTPHLPTLHSLLRSYNSNPLHWSPYAHANPLKQYTRNLVTELPGIFNLLLLVWTPGKRSPVHDHADSHCLMKVLKGALRESRFEVPTVRSSGEEKGLRDIGRLNLGVDKVAYISDKLGLHEISNPSPTEYAVSLHLYTPPNAAIYGCHVFDPETGESKHVMQSAYDSVRGVPGWLVGGE